MSLLSFIDESNGGKSVLLTNGNNELNDVLTHYINT